jgi:hypothetical protein
MSRKWYKQTSPSWNCRNVYSISLEETFTIFVTEIADNQASLAYRVTHNPSQDQFLKTLGLNLAIKVLAVGVVFRAALTV